jgi:Leucine-rich repeat (LRR) protein
MGLRTLLILIALACVWLSWMSHRNRQVKIEQAALDRIESYNSDPSFRYAQYPMAPYNKDNRRPGLGWLSPLFGEYPFVNVTELEFGYGGKNFEHLDDVAKLTQLKELEVGFAGEIPTLEPLRNLSKLEKLDIHCAYLIESLEPLENCHRLKDLSMSFAKLRDIEIVRHFPNMHRINLVNSNVVDLAPLGTAKKLIDVDVDGVVNTIAGLENATEIERLSIRSPMLKKFQPLLGLKKVKRLTLRCDHLDSLNVISQMKDLEYCHIESKRLRSLDGIEGLAKLKELRLLNCDSLENVQAVHGLNLKILTIREFPNRQEFGPVFPLADLSGIEDLLLLEKLDISNNSISDFSGLKNLRRLEELIAKHCTELRSLRGLNELVNLKRLKLDQCSGLPSLNGLAGLERLDVLGCYKCTSLTDISALQKLPVIRRANFYKSSKVVGGQFLLEMMPTAFVEAPELTRNSLTDPSEPFLNFKGTRVNGDWIVKLREKYPDFPVRGEAN